MAGVIEGVYADVKEDDIVFDNFTGGWTGVMKVAERDHVYVALTLPNGDEMVAEMDQPILISTIGRTGSIRRDIEAVNVG